MAHNRSSEPTIAFWAPGMWPCQRAEISPPDWRELGDGLGCTHALSQTTDSIRKAQKTVGHAQWFRFLRAMALASP
jgi:hypothetical protein